MTDLGVKGLIRTSLRKEPGVQELESVLLRQIYCSLPGPSPPYHLLGKVSLVDPALVTPDIWSSESEVLNYTLPWKLLKKNKTNQQTKKQKVERLRMRGPKHIYA